MEHRVRVNILSSAIVVGICLVLSIVTSVAVASRAYESRAKAAEAKDKWICVKGSSRQRISSDLAVWRICIRGEAKTLPDSFAVLEEGLQKLRTTLTSLGFNDSEVAMEAIETTTRYETQRDALGNGTRRIDGYTLSRWLTITTSNVRRVDSASGTVTQLLKDGVLVEASPPSYYYSKLPDLRVTILGDASKDARARADEVAKNAGSTIGEVRSAAMSPLQIVRPNSTDVSGDGRYDTSTIDKDVYAVVTLTFAISGH